MTTEYDRHIAAVAKHKHHCVIMNNYKGFFADALRIIREPRDLSGINKVPKISFPQLPRAQEVLECANECERSYLEMMESWRTLSQAERDTLKEPPRAWIGIE